MWNSPSLIIEIKLLLSNEASSSVFKALQLKASLSGLEASD